jgi:hypothetical protein
VESMMWKNFEQKLFMDIRATTPESVNESHPHTTP